MWDSILTREITTDLNKNIFVNIKITPACTNVYASLALLIVFYDQYNIFFFDKSNQIRYNNVEVCFADLLLTWVSLK